MAETSIHSLTFRSGESASQATSVRRFILALTILCCLFSGKRASADTYEILKQKKCIFLVTPADGLVAGESFQAKTDSGKTVVLRVRKKSKSKATLSMRGRDGVCSKTRGNFTTNETNSSGRPKFAFGFAANAGLFSVNQKFTPKVEGAAEGDTSTLPSDVSGLSGIGFMGGGFLRYYLTDSIGLEFGVSGLTASPAGKTVLSNNDDYSVSAKMTEVVLQPALVAAKCISRRLYCRFAGTFSLPLNAKLSIKSSTESREAVLKYNRFGGEAAAGFNLGSAITVNAGGQFTILNGTFAFTPDNEPVPLRPWTVFVFGGLILSF